MRKNDPAPVAIVFSLFKAGARVDAPTIAVGDAKIKIDGGAQGDTFNLPASDGAGAVSWQPTQAETNGNIVTLLLKDAIVAGNDWEPLTIYFDTRTEMAVWQYLDAAVSTRSTLAQADILSDATPFAGGNIDAPISGAAVPGSAMALTAGERTTLAGVIWNVLTSTLTTAGSVGKYVVDYLAAIVAKTNLLGTATVTYSGGGVLASGDVIIVRGDAYLDSLGRRLEWTVSTWNVAVGSTCVVVIQGVATLAATRLSATSIGLELTSVQSKALPEGEFTFYVQEITVGSSKITRLAGNWETRDMPES